MDEKIVLKVDGMTCSSCAEGISRHLLKKGVKNVIVNYEAGQVALTADDQHPLPEVIGEIKKLGYSASLPETVSPTKKGLSTLEIYFLISVVFTVPLLLHMFVSISILHNAYVQLLLSLPVVAIGVKHFGKSALGSVRHLQPNMDVLILTGSLSAFIYSVAGLINYGNTVYGHQYHFFESAAAIITFLLLGNLIEHRALKKTNSALSHLAALQPVTARRITKPLTDSETTEDINADQLKKNDLVLVNTGDKVPADGIIYWGSASIDESSMTGESLPVEKSENDKVLAGTLVLNGTIKMVAEATGSATVLNNIISLVANAAGQKPSIQRMGDKVSAWFVPIVLLISIVTFFISFFFVGVDLPGSFLRSIAVLVISCPCAMGLATPTAVSVGIGRAAKEGILVKSGRTLEEFSQSDIIVFDKTGTLTETTLSIKEKKFFVPEEEVLYIIHQLEKHSSHPVAKALLQLSPPLNNYRPYNFSFIEEAKGSGIAAGDQNGNTYYIGRIHKEDKDLKDFQVGVYRNNNKLAAFTLDETIRKDASAMISYFRREGLRIVLLSGDRKSQCTKIASALGIKEVFAEMLPGDKASVIENLKKEGIVTMAGDGINDSPSLSHAHIGLSFGSATQIAISSSDIVILSGNSLLQVVKVHQLAKATMLTIRQNLFWALIYNVAAIPIAATGLLSPVISSFSMAFSDVIVIGNSLRLKIKNIFTGQKSPA
jgi:P-type Cu+ transporter